MVRTTRDKDLSVEWAHAIGSSKLEHEQKEIFSWRPLLKWFFA